MKKQLNISVQVLDLSFLIIRVMYLILGSIMIIPVVTPFLLYGKIRKINLN